MDDKTLKKIKSALWLAKGMCMSRPMDEAPFVEALALLDTKSPAAILSDAEIERLARDFALRDTSRSKHPDHQTAKDEELFQMLILVQEHAFKYGFHAAQELNATSDLKARMPSRKEFWRWIATKMDDPAYDGEIDYDEIYDYLLSRLGLGDG